MIILSVADKRDLPSTWRRTTTQNQGLIKVKEFPISQAELFEDRYIEEEINRVKVLYEGREKTIAVQRDEALQELKLVRKVSWLLIDHMEAVDVDYIKVHLCK